MATATGQQEHGLDVRILVGRDVAEGCGVLVAADGPVGVTGFAAVGDVLDVGRKLGSAHEPEAGNRGDFDCIECHYALRLMVRLGYGILARGRDCIGVAR